MQKVLVVDDEKSIVEILEFNLKKEGYESLEIEINEYTQLRTVAYYKETGYYSDEVKADVRICYVGDEDDFTIDENGVVKLDELKAAIKPTTILVSVMFAIMGGISPKSYPFLYITP